MLLVIDEPTKFSVSLQQEFKNYITGDTQEVKEKYETAVFEANITNYAFTGNFLTLNPSTAKAPQEATGSCPRPGRFCGKVL
jgi:hypothetical protein